MEGNNKQKERKKNRKRNNKKKNHKKKKRLSPRRVVASVLDCDFLAVFIRASHQTGFGGGGPRGVMVKAMDYGIVVREFVLQLLYYVHFRANSLGKGMNPLILPAMG